MGRVQEAASVQPNGKVLQDWNRANDQRCWCECTFKHFDCFCHFFYWCLSKLLQQLVVWPVYLSCIWTAVLLRCDLHRDTSPVLHCHLWLWLLKPVDPISLLLQRGLSWVHTMYYLVEAEPENSCLMFTLCLGGCVCLHDTHKNTTKGGKQLSQKSSVEVYIYTVFVWPFTY